MLQAERAMVQPVQSQLSADESRPAQTGPDHLGDQTTGSSSDVLQPQIATSLVKAEPTCTAVADSSEEKDQQPDAQSATSSSCSPVHDPCLTVPQRSASVLPPASCADAGVELLESMECVVCWDASADVVFQPCGHACSCTACAESLIGKVAFCPMCRSQIDCSISMQP